MKKSIEKRLAKIRLFCTDVDGVLTDGGMYYGEDGVEQKKFMTQDGMGLSLLRFAGIVTAIVTSEETKMVMRRAEKLSIGDVYQGVKDKRMVVNRIREKYGLTWDQIAYIGDDINDLEVMELVGFSATPANGSRWNRRTARFITEAKGGEGCVRELCDMIIQAKGLDQEIVSLFHRAQRPKRVKGSIRVTIKHKRRTPTP